MGPYVACWWSCFVPGLLLMGYKQSSLSQEEVPKKCMWCEIQREQTKDKLSYLFYLGGQDMAIILMIIPS